MTEPKEKNNSLLFYGLSACCLGEMKIKKRQSLKKCARLIEKISGEVKVTFRHYKDYRAPCIF